MGVIRDSRQKERGRKGKRRRGKDRKNHPFCDR